MKQILFILCLLLSGLPFYAQQTGKVTDKFFPDPQIEIATPAFAKKHGFTNYRELMDYLHKLTTSYPDRVKLQIVGRTQRGRDIPMIKLSSGGSDKLRVLYAGCVHGNEPAGTEGLLYFMKQLVSDPKLEVLLDKIDFYILPSVNIDGSEQGERATANGIDLNRDQTLLSTPEARMLHRVASTVKPDVFIDFHEYKPLRASYEEVVDGQLLTNPNDFMFLWSSNPNVAPTLQSAIDELYVPEASRMADTEGLRHHTYFTTKSDRGDVVFNIGGSSPRSSSNIMALRGAVSMLMEIRGIGLGRTSYKRRVNTVYKLAESFARTTFDHAAQIRKAVDEAAHYNGDIAVNFRSKAASDYPLTFIDILGNKEVDVPVEARIAIESEVFLSRQRPVAYYLDQNQSRAVEILNNYGVKMERLETSQTLPLECYTVTSAVESHERVAGILPLNVKTQTDVRTVTLPAGSYRIPLSQPLATLVTVLLEPESANGFINYRVIDAAMGQTPGVYREIKQSNNEDK